jgi:hypothetical protein
VPRNTSRDQSKLTVVFVDASGPLFFIVTLNEASLPALMAPLSPRNLIVTVSRAVL